MKDIRREARTGALWSVLLAAALFMRILVPTGWMPVADASGLHFEICSGWAKAPLPEPAPDHHLHHGGHHAAAEEAPPHDHDPRKHSNQPCAFAGLAMAFLGAAHPAAIPPPAVEAVAPVRLRLIAPGRGLAAPPPPSTGPPLSA